MKALPGDRVCAGCDQILRWAGLAQRGPYRHCRPNGALYVTTHVPVPKPEFVPGA